MFDVSLIIPTRSRCAYLRQCLDAVSKTVTNIPWQIVIVDNGSTDATVDYLIGLPSSIAGAPVVLVSEPRPGVSVARNAGWRVASGNIMAFTDDDCYIAPNFIDAVARVFSELPHAGFIGGRTLFHYPHDQEITMLDHTARREFAPRSFIAAGKFRGNNMAFRQQTLEMIGGFDERMGAGTPFPGADIDAAAAALWLGIPGAYDPEPTVFHPLGRKVYPELREQKGAYDFGRGAYYVKYILNHPSRSLYLKVWAHRLTAELRDAAKSAMCGRVHTMPRARRELNGGIRFALTALRHPRHLAIEAGNSVEKSKANFAGRTHSLKRLGN